MSKVVIGAQKSLLFASATFHRPGCTKFDLSLFARSAGRSGFVYRWGRRRLSTVTSWAFSIEKCQRTFGGAAASSGA